MTTEFGDETRTGGVPVIDLSLAPGEGAAWDRPKAIIYAWAICELLFVTNPWQISSAIRVTVLRLFGAKIGKDVIIRPRTRIKFPWKLQVGDRSWIGEGAWFHNQDQVVVGADAVISQDTFITTGSHASRRDMGLITKPVQISDGAWVTARCVVLGGATIGRSSVITPNSVVPANASVPANKVFGTAQGQVLGERFALSVPDGQS